MAMPLIDVPRWVMLSNGNGVVATRTESTAIRSPPMPGIPSLRGQLSLGGPSVRSRALPESRWRSAPRRKLACGRCAVSALGLVMPQWRAAVVRGLLGVQINWIHVVP